MPAFKKLGPGDQIDNVLVLEPQWTLASGSSGWRGSPEGSASLNLYGGPNRLTGSSNFFASYGGTISEYRYSNIIPAARTYGTLRRLNPITASIEYVWMTNEEMSSSLRTRNRWGYEHWKTVMGLYDYYSRRDPDYTTASYDHYCLYFNSGSTNIVTYQDRTATGPNLFRCLPTGAFAFEAWVKPFVSGTAGNDMTIVSRKRSFKLKVDGNTNKLVWAKYDGTSTTVPSFVLTGSNTVTPGVWHHVAVRSDTGSLEIFLDLVSQGSGTSHGTLVSPASYTGSLHIGAEWGGSVTSGFEDMTGSTVGLAGTVFHGFIGEVRVWGSDRSSTQISASYNHRLTGSELAMPLLGQFRLSEGPLLRLAPATDPSGLQWNWRAAQAPGSGVLNWASNHQGTTPEVGFLYSFNSRPGPTWHPNDNTNYYLPKQPALTSVTGTNFGASGSAPVERMRVIHIPEAFYGRQIVPNSVVLTDSAFSSPRYGLVRTLIDDGRGNLFLSGSAFSSSLAFSTSATRATASYIAFPANTSSLYLEARMPGASPNGYGVTSTVNGSPGDTAFHLSEVDPFNMVLTIPVDGFSSPIGTMWQLYQFINSSSVYIQAPRPPVGNPNDPVYGSTWLPLGGGTAGTSSLTFERSTPSYRGVEWNKVGNVFYEQGLIVIRDPALLDFGATADAVTSHPDALLQVGFRGQSRVPVKTVVARIDRGELNRSLNPTYYTAQEDGYRAPRHPSASLYVTTVGLYNSDHELVGVARLAEPLRVRPRDRLAIKIRMDF